MPLLPPNIEMLVSGNKEEVQTALEAHGFQPIDILKIRELPGNQCEVLVPISHETRVEEWFMEAAPVNRAGCLVMYTL